MSDWAHLTKRFVGSLRPGGPAAADREWVASVLAAPELALWNRMYGPDRRHSVQVARDVERTLAERFTQDHLDVQICSSQRITSAGGSRPGAIVISRRTSRKPVRVPTTV